MIGWQLRRALTRRLHTPKDAGVEASPWLGRVRVGMHEPELLSKKLRIRKSRRWVCPRHTHRPPISAASLASALSLYRLFVSTRVGACHRAGPARKLTRRISGCLLRNPCAAMLWYFSASHVGHLTFFQDFSKNSIQGQNSPSHGASQCKGERLPRVCGAGRRVAVARGAVPCWSTRGRDRARADVRPV